MRPYLLLACLIPWAAPAAQEDAVLSPQGANDNDFFGTALGLQGAWLLASCPADDTSGKNSGSVRAFLGLGNRWIEVQDVRPAGLTKQDGFGEDLALSGSRLLVGAPGDDDGPQPGGAAWILERTGTTWAETAKLLPDAPSLNFGNRVALSGDTAVVGAERDPTGGLDVGAVFVFVREPATGAWTQQAKLLGSDVGATRYFGESVAVDGDRLLVSGIVELGAPVEHTWVFDRQDGVWTLQSELFVSGADLGSGMVLTRDGAVLGSPGGSPAVYVLSEQAGLWTPAATLTTGTLGWVNLDIGRSVAAAGGYVVAGAPNALAPGCSLFTCPENGAVRLFVEEGASWSELPAPLPDDGWHVSLYGSEVAIGSGVLAVASPGAMWTAGVAQGLVFVFASVVQGAEWLSLGHELGSAPLLTAQGEIEAGDVIELYLAGAPAGATAWLVVGGSAIDAPFKGGVLVPAPELVLPWSVDSSGLAWLAAHVPADLPAGAGPWLQAWIHEESGWSASNALTPAD